MLRVTRWSQADAQSPESKPSSPPDVTLGAACWGPVAGQPQSRQLQAVTSVSGSSSITVRISAATEKFKIIDSSMNRAKANKITAYANQNRAYGLLILSQKMPGFEILLLVWHGDLRLCSSHLPIP